MLKDILTIWLAGLCGWGLCSAILFIDPAAVDPAIRMVIRLTTAPLIFGLIAWLYFSRIRFLSYQQTAVLWLCMVVGLDAGYIGLRIHKSLAIFQDPGLTWLPFTLILCSTLAVGWWIEKKL